MGSRILRTVPGVSATLNAYSCCFERCRKRGGGEGGDPWLRSQSRGPALETLVHDAPYTTGDFACHGNDGFIEWLATRPKAEMPDIEAAHGSVGSGRSRPGVSPGDLEIVSNGLHQALVPA